MATPPQAHDHDSGEGLLSGEEARERVLSKIEPLQPLELPLSEAYGCVLAEDVTAERDMPDFASSAMDGVAVRSSGGGAAAGPRVEGGAPGGTGNSPDRNLTLRTRASPGSGGRCPAHRELRDG